MRDSRFRAHALACLLLPVVSCALPAGPQVEVRDGICVTGEAVPGLEPFEEHILDFMKAHDVIGAGVAVSKGGRLVYSRGFGFADLASETPVMPDSLFRIASVSKPITGVAILKLVEEGKLDLEARVFDLLELNKDVDSDTPPDPRWKDVTVSHLLHHTGGWDRGATFDPMFLSVHIAETLGVSAPATTHDIIRFMVRRPLDFDPGTRHVYSNFGYCLLGRVVEKVSGLSYEEYVRADVLAPMGVEDMWVGETLREGRRDNEVTYYPCEELGGRSVFQDSLGEPAPWPYGAWCLETMDAHGGWIASAQDLVRFAMALDDSGGGPALKAETIKALFARPEGPAGYNGDEPLPAYYASGWMVRPVGSDGKANHWHNGSFSGSASLLVRRWDGFNWAIIFNAQSNAKGEYLGSPADRMFHRAVAKVENWDEVIGTP